MRKNTMMMALGLITLAVIAISALAFGKNWRNKQFDRIDDEIVRKVPHLQEGVLKIDDLRINQQEVTVVATTDLASNVAMIVHHLRDQEKLLYLTTASHPEGVGELWLLDLKTGERTLLEEKAWGGRLSPYGERVLVWTEEQELVFLDLQGNELEKIGKHGASPIFSSDGRYIAYQKLADESFDGDKQSYFEFAYGMAVYDTLTKTETLLTRTEHGEDFGAVAFSKDMKSLYFNSGRNRQVALWFVDLTGENLERVPVEEDKARFVPYVTPNALWLADGKTIISSVDNEVTIIEMNPLSGVVQEMRSLENRSEPHWLKEGASLILLDNSKDQWQVFNLRKSGQ